MFVASCGGLPDGAKALGEGTFILLSFAQICCTLLQTASCLLAIGPRAADGTREAYR